MSMINTRCSYYCLLWSRFIEFHCSFLACVQ